MGRQVKCAFCRATKKIPMGKMAPPGWVRGMANKRYVCNKCKTAHQGETF